MTTRFTKIIDTFFWSRYPNRKFIIYSTLLKFWSKVLAGISAFHLFGHSRGVFYELSYANQYKEKVASVIVDDYLSEHKAMPAQWQEEQSAKI